MEWKIKRLDESRQPVVLIHVWRLTVAIKVPWVCMIEGNLIAQTGEITLGLVTE